MSVKRPLYYKVGPTIWDEPWTDDARYIAFYLLTCRHRTTEGLYRLPLSYVAEDTGWELERVQAAITELIEHEFIEYDPQARVVLIVEALKWQAPSTENHIKGAVRKLEGLPKTPLQSYFLCICDTYATGLADAIRMAFEWDAASHGDGYSHPQALAPPQTLNSSSGDLSASVVAGDPGGDSAAAALALHGIEGDGGHPMLGEVMAIAEAARAGDPSIVVEDSSVLRILLTAKPGVDIADAAQRAAARIGRGGDITSRHFFKALDWCLQDAAKGQVRASRGQRADVDPGAHLEEMAARARELEAREATA